MQAVTLRSEDKMNQFDFDETSFDKVASIYEEVRPCYGYEIYRFIDSIKRFNSDSKILEIGCGTGIATKEIKDFWNPSLISLEPGTNLISIVRGNLKDYNDIEILNTKFEDYKINGMLFDGIFSATAFHWIDPNVKYKKAFSLLKNKGFLILYWNNFRVKNKEVQNNIEEIYGKYGMRIYDKPLSEIQKEKIMSRKEEIENSGYFKIKAHKLFNNIFEYNSERYIKLLQTFSDHSKEKVPNIDKLLDEIKEIIINNNDKIELSVISNVRLVSCIA